MTVDIFIIIQVDSYVLQTMRHTFSKCSLTKYENGFEGLEKVTL